MKSRMFVLLLAVALGLVFAYAAWAELSAFDVAKKSLELEKSKSRTATYKMTVMNDRGKSRVYQFKLWEKEYPEGTKKLIRFVEPADANGTGLLTHERKGSDDLQWLFLPSRKSVRQLAAADKSDQFMGSDLFIEDMGELDANDYTHTLTKEEEVNGHHCYVIESKPKSGTNTAYSKSIFWVDKNSFGAVKAEIYDKNGKLLKALASDVEQVGGRYSIKKMEVSTPDKKTKTMVELVNVQYNPEIADNTFTTQFLERY
jgi:outer membrane lipoprotein-sorting protein